MPELNKVKIDKLVQGGQGLGVLDDGKKCFVWNALPGETVKAQITKDKKDYAEALAKEITTPSKERIEPIEPAIYLSTSPWQILDYQKEAGHKQSILQESFSREKIEVKWQDFYTPDEPYYYRNKMEFNFWWDNDIKKAFLALHIRGSHQKVPVTGSALASPAINEAVAKLLMFINKNSIQPRALKSVIIRSDRSGKTAISLFVVDKRVLEQLKGFDSSNDVLEIIYSNPKSPASVATEVLYQNGQYLEDTLLTTKLSYTPRSFFQVNLEAFEVALKDIKTFSGECQKIVDLFSGVGSIGLSVALKRQELLLIENDAESVSLAKLNALDRPKTSVNQTKSEQALESIESDNLIIVDPPRIGLEQKLLEHFIKVKPSRIIYLSCNPSTQARDAKALIAGGYVIKYARGFNFFPRTPHIESLIVFDKK
jgi:23S rRNA (uracil1939-C5)-methyltransferase